VHAIVPTVAGLAVGAAMIALFAIQFAPTPFPPDEALENAVIAMERTPCFGFCPDYSLTIFGNGTVIYEGRNFVETTGQKVNTISREDVRMLVNEFYEIDYFSLKDEYTDQVTDLPTTTTSIRIDGKFKQVVDYYGAPEQLKDLEDTIDDVAKSHVWIGAGRIQQEP
jgi:hypothetical protein